MTTYPRTAKEYFTALKEGKPTAPTTAKEFFDEKKGEAQSTPTYPGGTVYSGSTSGGGQVSNAQRRENARQEALAKEQVTSSAQVVNYANIPNPNQAIINQQSRYLASQRNLVQQPITRRTPEQINIVSDRYNKLVNAGYNPSEAKKMANAQVTAESFPSGEGLVVEQRSATGQLEERRYSIGGKEVTTESQLTGKPAVERQGKVSSFVIQKTPLGQVTGITTTREIEQPSVTTSVNASQVMSSAMSENNSNMPTGSYMDLNQRAVLMPTSGGRGTSTFVRILTPTELNNMQNTGAIENFGDLFNFATQYTGGYVTASLTPTERGKLTGINFLNPVAQYDVFASQKEYEKAVVNFESSNVILEQANKDYESGKIDYGVLTAKFNYYQSTPEYKKVLTEYLLRKTTYQRINESSLTPTTKNVLTGVVVVSEFLPYVSPPLRVLYGSSAISSGVGTLSTAKTTGDIFKGGLNIGIGTFLVKSGFKGGTSILGNKGSGESILSKTAQFERNMGFEIGGKSGGVAQKLLEFSETTTYTGIKKFGLPTILGTQKGIDIYGQTGNLGMSVTGGLTGFASIKVPMVYENIRSGTKINQLEKIKLLEEMNKLEASKITSYDVNKLGKGNLPNSDRVNIVAEQKSGNFIRRITIGGDLVSKGDKLFFFGNGQGEARTIGTFKIKGQPEKGLGDVQYFKVNQLGKGIPIIEMGDVKIGSTQSFSTYILQYQASKLFKVPKGIGIPYTNYPTFLEKVKMFATRSNIQRGGTNIFEYEKGKTFNIEKSNNPVDEQPFSTELKKFDITDASIKLGKVVGSSPIESTGFTFSNKRLGSFVNLGEPSAEINVMPKNPNAKKTPLSKTFARVGPEMKVETIYPEIKNPITSQVTINEMPNADINNIGRGVIEKVKTKVNQNTIKNIDILSQNNFKMPGSAFGGTNQLTNAFEGSNPRNKKLDMFYGTTNKQITGLENVSKNSIFNVNLDAVSSVFGGGLSNRNRQGNRNINAESQLNNQLNIQKNIQQPMLITGQREEQSTRQIQRQLQRNIQRTIQRQPSPVKIKTPTIKTPEIMFPPFKLKGGKQSFGGKKVKLFVKEKGLFKFKGLFPDVFKASNVGRFLTGESINRSYKILGGSAPLLPGYRKSRKKGQGNVFVELSKTSLSQLGEQRTVKGARLDKMFNFGKKMKGGKKRR
jgi:hypothetical protein